MRKIKIRIYPDAVIQAETNGIKGEKCKEYKEIISNLTGARIIEEEYTREYYETTENKVVTEIMEVDLNGI